MKADSALLEKWQAAWPKALAIWSRYTRLQPAMLCGRTQAAREAGLDGSFAMIRFADQRVVIDLQAVAELGLDDYALEILAHEIGHHVLAPANATDNFRLLARMRQALPTLTCHAPMLANLYTDLLINDRLQRQSGLRMADIYPKITGRADDQAPAQAGAWDLTMRIYERLWQLEKGSLCAARPDERFEADAWLGARLIRVYARDWLDGAGRFAALMLSYIVADDERRARRLCWLHDMASAGCGCNPYGIIEIEPGEIGGAIHPAEDPLITGEDGEAEEDSEGKDDNEFDMAGARHGERAGGQAREPFEYGEILRASGIEMSEHDIAIRYYHERALPYLIPYPRQLSPSGAEPLPEGLEPWDCGDPLDTVDWLQSVLQSPRVIPGMTTVKRLYGEQPGEAASMTPIDLDIYVDSSGSMPDPRREVSWLALAGAIIALSALRVGAKVQVTLWSGKRQVRRTPGFIADPREILAVLTDYFGGATAFPIHCLRETYAAEPGRKRATHILMISDDGIDTMFAQDEKRHSGWNIAAHALARAGAGGTLALNLPPAYSSKIIDRAVHTQGWALHRITDWEQLMAFACDFSYRHRGGLAAPGRQDG
ncbi:MAG: VWA domain-containing protein [Azoarcus sp.]|jgi:hypothetical protein|nr:VWA domain-containing protein [Azoarcus sp.]